MGQPYSCCSDRDRSGPSAPDPVLLLDSFLHEKDPEERDERSISSDVGAAACSDGQSDPDPALLLESQLHETAPCQGDKDCVSSFADWQLHELTPSQGDKDCVSGPAAAAALHLHDIVPARENEQSALSYVDPVRDLDPQFQLYEISLCQRDEHCVLNDTRAMAGSEDHILVQSDSASPMVPLSSINSSYLDSALSPVYEDSLHLWSEQSPSPQTPSPEKMQKPTARLVEAEGWPVKRPQPKPRAHKASQAYQQLSPGGVAALVEKMASTYGSPQKAFEKLDVASKDRISMSEFDSGLRHGMNINFEELTGLKIVPLFSKIQKKKRGILTADDLARTCPEIWQAF